MTHSLVQKRDELIKQLEGQPGFISVGIAKKKGDLVLLVAVDSSFHGNVPETFHGIGVVTEGLGQAEIQYPRGKGVKDGKRPQKFE